MNGRIRPQRYDLPPVRRGRAQVRFRVAALELYKMRLERPGITLILAGREEEPDEHLIARMKCPICGSYSATKDVLSGQYVCPCGWKGGPRKHERRWND